MTNVLVNKVPRCPWDTVVQIGAGARNDPFLHVGTRRQDCEADRGQNCRVPNGEPTQSTETRCYKSSTSTMSGNLFELFHLKLSTPYEP